MICDWKPNKYQILPSIWLMNFLKIFSSPNKKTSKDYKWKFHCQRYSSILHFTFSYLLVFLFNFLDWITKIFLFFDQKKKIIKKFNKKKNRKKRREEKRREKRSDEKSSYTHTHNKKKKLCRLDLLYYYFFFLDLLKDFNRKVRFFFVVLFRACKIDFLFLFWVDFSFISHKSTTKKIWRRSSSSSWEKKIGNKRKIFFLFFWKLFHLPSCTKKKRKKKVDKINSHEG